MVLGLLCEGTTVIRNAERLRIKESDRIEPWRPSCGPAAGSWRARAAPLPIQWGCRGLPSHAREPAATSGLPTNRPPVVVSLAGGWPLAAGLALPISGAEAIAKSWPDFLEAIKPLGAEVEHVG